MRGFAGFLTVFATFIAITIAVATGGRSTEPPPQNSALVTSPAVAGTPLPYNTFGPTAPTPTLEPQRGRHETTLIDLQTGSSVALWAHDEQVFRPVFSPDGRWLLYTKSAQGSTQLDIYRVDLNSPDLQPELFRAGILPPLVPSYSSRGDLVFMRRDGDKSMPSVMTQGGTVHELAMPGHPTSWSPDGRWLTYEAAYESEDAPIAQRLVNIDTWEERVIGASKPCGCDANPRPSWAPDSRHFIYTYILGEIGEEARFISEIQAVDSSEPSAIEPGANPWSHDWLDGTHYVERVPQPDSALRSDFYSVDLATGERALLFESITITGVTQFSPDLRHLAYQNGRLRVLDLEGGAVTLDGSFRAWSADSDAILSYAGGSDCGPAFLLFGLDGERILCAPSFDNQDGVAFALGLEMLAYLQTENPGMSDRLISNDVYVMDIETGLSRLVARDLRGYLSCLKLSPDERFLVVGGFCGDL